MSTPTLAARNDIHKSCKTFEAVVNYLNDYSEAVTAIIGIQKKLAKALRDAASPPRFHIWFPEGSHNDIVSNETAAGIVLEFFRVARPLPVI